MSIRFKQYTELVKRKSNLSFYCINREQITVLFFKNLSELFAERFPNLGYNKVFIIADKKVNFLYGNNIKRALLNFIKEVSVIEVPDEEAAKSFPIYYKICNKILNKGIDRNSLIITLGGGTVCNVGGFVASTIFRGIDLIHMPTTVLAQNDAAIGNKQAINTKHGKNLIGSYYSPREVWIVREYLKTLGKREIASGLAESIKHALAQDTHLFEYINKVNIFKNNHIDINQISEIIYITIKDKILLMEKDTREENIALALQYGHTIGHAVEFLSKYELSHGEAISVGMYCAAQFANKLGILPDSALNKHIDICSKFNLPYKIPKNISSMDIIDNLKYNKKNKRNNSISFVLLSSIGHIYHEGSFYEVNLAYENIISLLDHCY